MKPKILRGLQFLLRRKVVDLLTITNSSHGEIFNCQECIQDELTRYLRYNHPELIIIQLNGENPTGKILLNIMYVTKIPCASYPSEKYSHS